MIKIGQHKSLKQYNTFGINAKATYFTTIQSIEELQELLQLPLYQNEKHLILGGGSNVLFTNDFNGLVIKVESRGIYIVEETDETITLKVNAGEVWHDLVAYCVQHDWGGIENLSLIPGLTGAAPIQNIGAYGVEIKNVINGVEGVDLKTGTMKSFKNAECCFGYRESAFKLEWKEKYFISSITLRLTKRNYKINHEYGAIQEVLKQHHIHHATIKDISDAVIAIRQSKLPDPLLIGNAGSFFKNPTVSKDVYHAIKANHPTIQSYSIDSQSFKVPAGWLIEQCGWKGKKFGGIGVHPFQALVLVNYGNGNGEEIFELAMKIKQSVKEKFGVILNTEVNII